MKVGLVERSTGGASWACRDGYVSVWNGRDELIHRPLPPPAPFRICCLCWNRRPPGDFDRRRICRRCVRLQTSARLREDREAARTTGLCQACLKRPAAGGLTVCERCRVRHRALNVTRRQRLRDEGRCAECTASLPSGWKRPRCGTCLDSRRRRAAELRRDRLAAGLCRDCGRRPRAVLVRGGLATQCRRCLDRAAERKRAARRTRLGEAAA